MYAQPPHPLVPSPTIKRLTPADRTKRVREARDEAKKEIEAYRANKEAEYKEFEAQVLTLTRPPHAPGEPDE